MCLRASMSEASSRIVAATRRIALIALWVGTLVLLSSTRTEAVDDCPASATNPSYLDVVPASAADHGDVADVGSIAYCLNMAKATGKIGVNLKDVSTPYNAATTIVVPDGTVMRTLLGTKWESDAQVRAIVAMTTLVRLSNDATLWTVEFHGNFLAEEVVTVGSTSGVTIRDSVVHKSSLDPDGNYANLVGATGATNLVIKDTMFRRAGYSPELNSGAVDAQEAAAIRASNGHDIVIKDNNISQTLTAGVNIGDSYNVVVEANTITYTGRGLPIGGPTADGITGYHYNGFFDGSGPSSRNIDILSNVVDHYWNHGIHVSGKDIKLDGNQISGSQGPGRPIRIDDHASPADCNNLISLTNNILEKDSFGSYIVINNRHKDHEKDRMPAGITKNGNLKANGNPIGIDNITIWENAAHC